MSLLRAPHPPLLPLAVTLASISLAGGCSSDPATTVRLESREGRLFDSSGREVIHHGVNARVLGLFDVSFDDGREKLEEIPPFTEDDCRFLGEELGLNHLRLPVNWSGIEPHDDDFRADYVQRIVDLAAACDRHGVATLVDFHQDAFSKEIGEDGAPLWAIHPAPTMLLEGPLTDLNARRGSTQVQNAFSAFFSNAYGGWDEFAEMAEYVARRVDGKPGIVGIEIYNEPVVYFDDDALVGFHRHVADRIRGVAPGLTVYFEPSALRNVTDFDPATPTIGIENAVYAPHTYVDVFENGWMSEDISLIDLSVSRARDEADAHGAALYLGEFGHDDTARGTLYVREAMRAFDEQLGSWAYWLYEEWSQDSWGLYDAAPTTPPTRGALREARADLLARAYPAAVDGRLERFVYDDATRTLTVTLASAGLRDHVLAAPARTYESGVETSCDGVLVPSEHARGRVYVRCSGTTLVMRPAP